MFQKATALLGRRFFQYFAAVAGSLGVLSSEMHFGWSSPALPVLTNGTYFFQMSSEKASWLAVILFPGMACGAIISSFIADIVGRKKIILGTSIPLFFSWLMLALARGDLLMFLGRFLGGVSCGLSFASVPMYLGEISEPQIRGLLSSLCPVFVVVGLLLVNVLGVYLTIDVSAYLSCAIPLISFCTFIWMPESPVLLMSKGQNDQALKNLKMLRGAEEGEKEFIRLSKELSIQAQSKEDDSFLDLWTIPANRKAFVIALGLRSVQQLCGSTAITFYCKTIFEETDGFVSANSGTIIYFSLQAVLAVFASFVLDSVGRRPMFIFSLSGTTLTLFVIGVYMLISLHSELDLSEYKYVPMIALFLNVGFFSLGVRNVPLLVMSEVFHPKVKSLAMCVVTIYYGILAIVVTKFYHVTNEMFEMAYPMFTFGVLSLISLVIYCIYVPETKGKTLEDIQKMLNSEL